jgi:hypothetical protein
MTAGLLALVPKTGSEKATAGKDEKNQGSSFNAEGEEPSRAGEKTCREADHLSLFKG